MAAVKKIIIIAGPNGAVKTSFATTFLPGEAALPNFINADLIAAGLSPFKPEAAAIKAGRLMLEAIQACVTQGKSFSFETALSGKRYLSRIRQWRDLGYHVSLYFLQLSDEAIAVERVAVRVKQGGHNIPEAVIRRRFKAGLSNRPLYCEAVDDWVIYDNGGDVPDYLDGGSNS